MEQTPVTSIPRVARLELTWEHLSDSNHFCFYELVLPLEEADCRGTWDRRPQKRPMGKNGHTKIWLDKDNCKRIPLGRTGVGTTNLHRGEDLYTPFRDGAHCQWDAEKLKLPVYVIDGDRMALIQKE